MDAFKILSRSTNLSRNRNAQKPRVIPSSGEASTPRLYRDDEKDLISPKARIQYIVTNKKRKRGDVRRSSPVETPEELDFFRKVGNAGAGNAIGIVRQKTDEAATGNFAEEESPMSQEQCKQILKAHKLKITMLNSSTPFKQYDGSSKIRKRGARSNERLLNDAEKKNKEGKMIIPQPLLKFSQLRPRYDLARRLAENIEVQGYQIPTEVQLGTLPLLLGQEEGLDDYKKSEGGFIWPHMDLLTVAPTGSGKTISFLIPILNSILKQRKVDHANLNNAEMRRHFSGTQAVILAPTKELAGQIANEARKLALKTGVKVCLVRKGMIIGQAVEASAEEICSDNGDNEEEYHENVTPRAAVKAHILVATPLSLVHALTTENATFQSLPSVRYFVGDEADVLLDPLFRDQTLMIWRACTNPLLRISLWSATMGASIEESAKSSIQQRWQDLSEEHGLHEADKPELYRVIVGIKDSAIPNIEHRLIYAATEPGKLIAMRQMMNPTTNSSEVNLALCPPFLVFTQTIARAIALHSELIYDIPQEAGGSSRIAVLHSDLSDASRDILMTRFRKGEIWVLITTDLLSRGVDFKGVNGVINYDFPNSSAAYVHRVGRTGRAGRDGGVAVTLYTKEDVTFLKSVANVIAMSEKHREAGDTGTVVKDWLLEALPKVSKKEKQRLKRHGVEMRRTKAGNSKDSRENQRARISTRSGYDRRLENKKQAARRRSAQVAQLQESMTQQRRTGDEAFEDFDD